VPEVANFVHSFVNSDMEVPRKALHTLESIAECSNNLIPVGSICTGSAMDGIVAEMVNLALLSKSSLELPQVC
jgi:hypothetical protein